MMNNVNYYTEAPLNYLTCFKTDCPKASTCLRQLVAMQTPPDHIKMLVINPRSLKAETGDCNYYRPSTIMRFAKGFLNLVEELPLKQGKKFVSEMITHFNRRDYYYMRKGELLMSAERQEVAARILKSCGVAKTIEFDEYVDEYNW